MFIASYFGVRVHIRSNRNLSAKLFLKSPAKIGFFTRKFGEKPIDLKQQGMTILEEYKKSFNIVDDKQLSPLRIYSRTLKQANGIRKDSFITFKPRLNHTYWNQSPILNKLIQKDTGQMGYGLALYNGRHKVWIAPYGNQLEFMQTLRTNYVPFLDLINNPGIPHFIGFFPDLNYHQVYYYLGKNAKHVDPRLADLKPDYFGMSRTYDSNWNTIKENTYAIRVPFSNYSNKGLFELPAVPYLNISYRQKVDAQQGASEESVSYLCYKR